MNNEQKPQVQKQNSADNEGHSKLSNTMQSVKTAPPLVKHEFAYDPKTNNAETRDSDK